MNRALQLSEGSVLPSDPSLATFLPIWLTTGSPGSISDFRLVGGVINVSGAQWQSRLDYKDGLQRSEVTLEMSSLQ